MPPTLMFCLFVQTSLLSEGYTHTHTHTYSPLGSSVPNWVIMMVRRSMPQPHHDASFLGFAMTLRRPKPQPRHGALEKCVVWGKGPAPLRLGSWPHVLSSGVRVLPLFLCKAWVLAVGIVGGTGPAPLRLGSWPHVNQCDQDALKM